MNRRLAVLSLLILLPAIYFAYLYYGGFKKIVSVNGVTIKQAEINEELQRLNTFYAYSRQQNVNKEIVKQDVFNRLVEDKIVENYAKEKNITVSDEEVMKVYQEKIKDIGEENLLNQLKQMYGIDKNGYLEVIKKDILREKVQKSVGKPLAKWLSEEVKKAEITK